MWKTMTIHSDLEIECKPQQKHTKLSTVKLCAKLIL